MRLSPWLSGSRRLCRSLAALLTLLGTVTAITLAPAPASAELAEVQETWWGLETVGTSRVLNGWRMNPLGWAVEPVGGAMFVGGQFLDITNGSETIRQPYLAAFDAGDGRPLRWVTPDVGGPVLALEATDDGGLLVGGEMDEYNGVNVGSLTKIDPTTGELWPGWSTRVYGGSGVVRDIRNEPDGWTYAVGSFTTATDGDRVHGVAGAIRFNSTTGAIDWSWKPQVSGGSVWGVSVSRTDNRVYLAGWFTEIDGDSSARGFASVDHTTADLIDGRDTIEYNTCNGCVNNYRMYDVLATEYGDVWVVGEQHAVFILEEDNNLEMRLMHYTGCNTNFQATCQRAGGEFQEIERVGNRIYATCHCWGWHQSDTDVIFHSSTPTGTPTGSISSVAAYDPESGDRIQSMNPYMSGDAGGFAIAAASDGCLWLAGGYHQVGQPGNQRRARDLVRICDSAGPGPDPQPNPVDPNAPGDVSAPATCAASNDGTAATLTWDEVDNANSYRIYRSVNDSTLYWRGKMADTVFNDTLRSSGDHAYYVSAVGDNGVWSPNTLCAPNLDPVGDIEPVLAPATCTSDNVGTAATISWDAAANATNYRVNRSVNGGTSYWRGATTDTELDDTLRPTGSHQYTVQARGVDGVWSETTTCGAPLDPTAGVVAVDAPSDCVATVDGQSIGVSWTAPVDGVDYRIYRSVNDGNTFWRGLVSNDTFFGDTAASNPDSTYDYTVQARGENRLWSESASCLTVSNN